ncbi:CIA30 family protein [Gilvimarinus sp. 1_MG-2023]|uniref:CIA30 family protein n=1 Tax=Gilvimarinus sp. 1_MG-2023 TaxID=3062638 RepID=UPI0026E31BCB|nr:CIA30 family protein [Gilvimarinus sp. 1_MG-2023]MDO6746709.1 CIA30 family protein [Gilvimarinus sp. 1_MG-2023]
MHKHSLTKIASLKSIALAATLSLSGVAWGGTLPPVVDTFDKPENNSLGLPRQLITDSLAGGGSTAQHTIAEGVITVDGEITPARGQLGWVSLVLPLDVQGGSQNAQPYTGILLSVKLNKGVLSVTVNGSEIQNHDYHAAPVTVTNDGEFHQVKVPFESLKRAWSEQTPLNTGAINGISIVAYAMQPERFSFALDQVSFY